MKKVLLVDRNDDAMRLRANMLRKEGYDVTESDGMLPQGRFDAVLYVMPGADARTRETIGEIRQMNPGRFYAYSTPTVFDRYGRDLADANATLLSMMEVNGTREIAEALRG